MDKTTIKKWGKYDNITHEKQILNIVNHPYIISMVKSIETEHFVH